MFFRVLCGERTAGLHVMWSPSLYALMLKAGMREKKTVKSVIILAFYLLQHTWTKQQIMPAGTTLQVGSRYAQ